MDLAATEIYPLSLHDALPISTPAIDMSTNGVAYVVWSASGDVRAARMDRLESTFTSLAAPLDIDPADDAGSGTGDRKSTRLNSSHTVISYAVFCLKKKNIRSR